MQTSHIRASKLLNHFISLSGGQIVMPGSVGLMFPFGRSLSENGQIQLDSDHTLQGGIMPTTPIPRNASNVIAWMQGKITGQQDIELEFAQEVLAKMVKSEQF